MYPFKGMPLSDFTRLGPLATGRGADSCFLPRQQGREGLLRGQMGSGEALGTCHSRFHTQRSTRLSLLVGLWFPWANQLPAPGDEASPGKAGRPLGPGGPSNLQI